MERTKNDTETIYKSIPLNALSDYFFGWQEVEEVPGYSIFDIDFKYIP